MLRRFGILAMLLLAQLAFGQQSALVGRWRSSETSKGGLGALYEFHADGSASFSPGAIVEMDYRLEGDELILPPATTTGPEEKSKLIWVSDDKFRMEQGGDSRELQRRGPKDPQDRLLGEWTGSYTMDGHLLNVRMFFYPGGKSLLLMPFTTQVGRYSVKAALLTAEFGGKRGFEDPFEVQGNQLVIYRANKNAIKLVRY